MPPKAPPPVAPRRNTGTQLQKPEAAGSDVPTAEAEVAPVETVQEEEEPAAEQTEPAPASEEVPAPAPAGPQVAPPPPPAVAESDPEPAPATEPEPEPESPAPVAAPTVAPVASPNKPPSVPAPRAGPPSTPAPKANKPPASPAPVAPAAESPKKTPPSRPPSRPAQPPNAAATKSPPSKPAPVAGAAAKKNDMFESSEDEDEEEAVPEGYVDPEDEMDGPATSAPPPAAPPPVAAPIPGAAAGGAPSLLEYFRAANPNAMDTSVRDILLAEGTLTKIKNAKAKNKARHFRLTENTFSYYESNAGALIAKVKKTDIIHVEDVVNTKQFRMRTSVDFGRDEGSTEMLLQAKDVMAKEKWLAAFSTDLNRPPKDYERLICEGYLIKVQPMCTVSTTRWFVATNRTFGYYKAEGGPLYYKVLWEHIQYVSETSNKKEFKLQASVPMTKTGFYDCTCRAKSKEERDKWVAMIQRILPQQKMSTELQMCCFMEE